MDLILDDGGAFAWSRGPTTAPILSSAARRLTVEPLPSVGSAPRRSRDGATGDPDPPAAAGLADPLDHLGPGATGWQIDPAAWAATQFAAARLGDRRRAARLVTLAQQ